MQCPVEIGSEKRDVCDGCLLCFVLRVPRPVGCGLCVSGCKLRMRMMTMVLLCVTWSRGVDVMCSCAVVGTCWL